MDEFWGKALIFAFVLVLVLLCIIQGCFSSDRQCGPCKSLQYCRSQYYQMMTHRRSWEHREVCQNQILNNGYVMVTTGLTTQQTPHFHGSGSNRSRQLDGNFEKQSRRLKEADPIFLFSHGLKELVTGKSASGIYKSVLEAFGSKKLNEEIDASANWPSGKATKMAKIGLDCCSLNRKERPDLATKVWKVVQFLKPRSPVL